MINRIMKTIQFAQANHDVAFHAFEVVAIALLLGLAWTSWVRRKSGMRIIKRPDGTILDIKGVLK